MTVNRKSVAMLALVAVVGVGLVGAYRSSACDGEKSTSASASKAKKAGFIHASAGDCGKSTGAAKQASSKGGECASAKTASKAECASAKKTSGGSACCAEKGAAQASTAGTTSILPVGAGSGCPHSSVQTTGAACKTSSATCAFTDNCDGCKMYKKYWSSLESASREVVTLPDGILIHMTSDDAAVVSDLQKYSDEKAEMMHAIANKTFDGKLCSFCEERARSVRGASFRVANASNGVYTIITSGAPETVGQLHKIAEAETATKTAISG